MARDGCVLNGPIFAAPPQQVNSLFGDFQRIEASGAETVGKDGKEKMWTAGSRYRDSDLAQHVVMAHRRA
jgi:hypothetical protein